MANELLNMSILAKNMFSGKLKDWCSKMPNIFILPPLQFIVKNHCPKILSL